ncbi:MAG: von Willebrand factor type A domain-containing protein [Huintestinicola sp.]|uniref:vWA domain-containing protein n=1 Tax=Huintestinicola sp. TaxID=2981661 RepID=UPI003F004FAF
MKKKLSAILAAAMALSCAASFPAEARSQIDTSDLPTLFSSKEDESAILKFKKSKPKLTADSREYNYYSSVESRTLRWEPVDNALLYYVYAKPSNKKSYEKIGATYDTEFFTTYSVTTSYCIRAVSYDDTDKKIISRTSNKITLKYRANRPVPYDGVDCGEGVDYDYEEEVIEEAEYDLAYEPAEAPAASSSSMKGGYYPTTEYNTEEYSHSDESGFKKASTDPVSTFAADVDTASYANIRRLINDGSDIPEDAVRIEEMINYFDYDYGSDKRYTQKLDTFSVYSEIADCPWNEDAKLLQLGIEAYAPETIPDSNLVFLVDVSGSMDNADKLPLVKESIEMLTKNMSENDTISIVTYSGEERTVLAGAKGSCINAVTDLASCMEASGCTNGESGINAAYEIAEKYFIEGGNNRIILCTDGDLNVGISDEGELKKLIEKKRESGVFFTVLGYGKGNIKDNKMETLADNGNGSYHYIDCSDEAAKVLIEERTENIITAAKDVKIQTEFNPEKVKSYRLIGYDNRRLGNEDFDNDTKDGGEVGAGQSVTVLYEIIPADTDSKSSLKYQKSTGSNEWCTVKIRCKEPDSSKSKLVSASVDDSFMHKTPSSRMKLAGAAAMFGMYLKNSEYMGSSDPYSARELLKGSASTDAQNLSMLIEYYIQQYFETGSELD